MNEINKLIWPSPDGIGVIDKADWDQTVDVALNTKNDQGRDGAHQGARRPGLHERLRREGARA